MVVGDFLDAAHERAAEDAWEGDGVIDLIWEVAPSRGDDCCTSLSGDVWHDFRGWICERKDDRLVSHLLDHVRCEQLRFRDTNEDVGTGDGVVERAAL